MFKFFSCLCCQSVDMKEERFDTRQFTRFPSTYHLRTLFDEYRYMSDFDNSENSEIGDLPEGIGEIEGILEDENEDELHEDELQERLSSYGSRLTTEKNEIEVLDINSNRSSARFSSGNHTNRSKCPKKNRKNYRK